jgi:CRISPR type I-E-associated protein CasB/Cse2
MNNVQEQAKKIVNDLQKLKHDKGAMSNLRKGLSKTLAHKSYRYIARWCNLENERMRIITQFVAAFFAMHPKHIPGTNFGKSFRIFAGKKDVNKGLENHEKYLERLLACRDSESLCERLSFVIRMVKGMDIPIDYETLYKDIVFWNERTQLQWANSYYIVDKECSSPKKEENNVSN